MPKSNVSTRKAVPPSVWGIVFTSTLTVVAWLGFGAFLTDLIALDARGIQGQAEVVEVVEGGKTSYYELKLLKGNYPTMTFDIPRKTPVVGEKVVVEYDPLDISVFRPQNQRIEAGLIALPLLASVGTVSVVFQTRKRKNARVVL